MATWLRKFRARRRLGLEDRLGHLQRQIRGIESESAYLREMIQRCAVESAEAPDDALDTRMAHLTDELRRSTEFLRVLIAEELALRRRLGITS